MNSILSDSNAKYDRKNEFLPVLAGFFHWMLPQAASFMGSALFRKMAMRDNDPEETTIQKVR